MAVNIPAILMMVAFYAFVLGIGIWASVKSKKLENARTGWLEMSFLANRSVSLFVGIFTMSGEKMIVHFFTNNRCHLAQLFVKQG